MRTLAQKARLRRLGLPDPFAVGIPQVPLAATPRGYWQEIQQTDRAAGRFVERTYEFPPFPTLTTAAPSSTKEILLRSLGSKHLRLIAMRGVLQGATLPLVGVELANIFLRLTLNAQQDLIQTGSDQAQPQSNMASFAALFSTNIVPGVFDDVPQTMTTNSASPWFWFAAPPRLRSGDKLTATVLNTFLTEGGVIPQTPELTLRVADDRWWNMTYSGRG